MVAVKSIDDLSQEDRSVIVFALQALLASTRRSERSAKSEAVRLAYVAEAGKLEILIGRFR